MNSIGFRGGVATVKRLRTRNSLQYLLVAIYWSSETLLGDLGRNECKPSMSTEQVVSEKVIYCCTSLTRTSTNVHDFEPIAMHAAINPSQLRHVISISLARSMHMHATTRANNQVGR